MEKLNQKYYNTIIYFLIGFTTIIAQVIFIREFMIAFYGNELTIGLILAFWLGWIALGSILFNKLFKRVTSYFNLIPIFLLLLSLFLPSTVYLIRIARTMFISVPGELPGLIPIIMNTAIIISPVCLISGAFFALASKHHSSDNALSTSIVYKYEAIGSATGGVLLSFFLLGNLNSFQILIFLSFLNAFLAFTLLWNRITKIVKMILVILCVGFVTISGDLGTELHLLTTLDYWKNYKFLESRDSVYGHISIIEVDGEKSIYSNGIKLMSSDNNSDSEEIVHYAMLQHKNPENVLVIGSSHPNVFAEILKYKSVKKIEYVELDPIITELSQKYFTESWKSVKSKINLVTQDGRLYVNYSKKHFDVILLNIGDPLNANINRFYTIEFFEKIKSILSPSGIFTFHLTSSENFLSNELIDLLKIVYKSLQEVFTDVKFIPGASIHFFSSNATGNISLHEENFVYQLKEKRIENHFVNEYYLHFKLLPAKIHVIEELIQPKNSTRINHDFQPIAYFFNLVFWGSQFSSIYSSIAGFIKDVSFTWIVVSILFLMIFVFGILILLKSNNLIQQNIKISIFILGFTLITIEIIILLGYQAIYGYIYNQMAALIGFFMAGIAFGSGLFLKQKSINENSLLHKLIIFQVILGILPIIVLLIFQIESVLLSQVIIFLFTLICGFVGGYHFPLASKIYFTDNHNIGILYGLDILGGMFGTFLFGIICIPLYGFLKVASIILLINIIAGLFVFFSSRININS